MLIATLDKHPCVAFCHVRLAGPKPRPKAYPKRLKTLGDHIRKRRLDLDQLQKEAAEQIGVDAASIGNWESNKIQPMVHCLPAILTFLGYNPLPEVDDLIGKFKRVRCGLGLSQEQLGQTLGIDESTIAGWERGETKPVGSYRKLFEDFVAGDGLLPPGPGTAPDKSRFIRAEDYRLATEARAYQSSPRQAGRYQRQHPLALRARRPETARPSPEVSCRPDTE